MTGTAPSAAGKRRRRPLRRVFFAGLLLAMLWGVVEIGALGVFWASRGDFSFEALHAEQRQRGGAMVSRSEAPRPDPEEFGAQNRLHPYLGFVLDSRLNWPPQNAKTGAPVSRFGFRADASPVTQREPDRVVIGITGGSVAGMMSRYGAEVFIDELRRHAAFADKRIDLVPLAIGGFKQPQQLLALTYVQSLGGEFDLVVNLDGFNEIALPLIEGRPDQWPAAAPRLWNLYAEKAPDPQVRRLIGRADYLGTLRRDLASAMDGPWRWSVATNLLWRTVDDALARWVASAEQALERVAVDADTRGGTASREGYLAELVELWRRCSQQLDELCRARGIRYYHFLQPNQYVPGSKPLTDEERATAFAEDSQYREPVRAGYPALRAAGRRLQASEVRFADLTMLFASREETLYIDSCCHLNQLGNELLAREMARVIARDHGEGAIVGLAPVTKLACPTERLTLREPFERHELRLVGTAPDGSERDVTYAGIAYSSSDPSCVAVDRWGRLRAGKPGSAVVTAELDGLVVEVPVEVQLAPLVDLGGGYSPRRGERLSLEVEKRGEELVLSVHGAVEARAASLVASHDLAHEPLCGGVAFVPVLDAQSVPLQLEPSGSELVVPIAPDLYGRTLIVQVFVQEPDLRCGFGLSNAIAVTLER